MAIAEDTTAATAKPRDSLSRLLDPRSIAIIGASPKPGSFGSRTQSNLDQFYGSIFLVNPNYDQIGAERCYASVCALPDTTDCAVIAVAQERVEDAVRDCVEAGVGGVIVYAAGYAETNDPERVALQLRLAEIVKGSGTRLLGPNCMGVTNYTTGARITFGRMPARRPLGAISLGIVTQSGALSMSLAQAAERGISVSHTFTSGNSSDVTLPELVGYLAHEPSCQSIVCAFEGVKDIAAMLKAARAAYDNGKPLIVYKMATSERGAAAALSHTGTLAGSAATYKAAFESVGAIMVDSFEEIIETAMFFAKAGRPRGQGPVSVVTSGGAGIIIADKSEEFGVPMPQPRGRTLEVLQANVPQFGSIGNPTDLTAQTMNDDRPVRACAAAVMSDDTFDLAILPFTYADGLATQRLGIWRAEAEKNDKLICILWASQWLEGPGSCDLEADPRVAVFRSSCNLFRSVALWYRRDELVLKTGHRRLTDTSVREGAKSLLQDAARSVLTERQSKQILALYGVPGVDEVLAHTATEAVEAARSFDRLVVMKIESADIPHKTEAKAIRLNLSQPAEIETAFGEIIANARSYRPDASIAGVLVQPMVSHGVEVMVGGRIDPLFGPLIVLSLGGVFVELLKDSVVQLAPVSTLQARRMIETLRGVDILKGYRGSEPVDIDRLAEVVARLSEFIADQSELVAEMDVNPLICSGSSVVAVDALLVRQD